MGLMDGDGDTPTEFCKFHLEILGSCHFLAFSFQSSHGVYNRLFIATLYLYARLGLALFPTI